MPTDNIINRGDAESLMPEEVSEEFLSGLDSQSSVLTQFRRVPVGRAQVRFPVLSALPVAYWVTGDTGLKQTTKAAWKNKFLNIEEIAVIQPVPENVIDDAEQPIWEQVRPLLEQAAGRLLDETVYFGVDAPATFPDAIVTAADAVGNKATITTTESKKGGVVGDQDIVLSKVEQEGYDPAVGVAAKTLRSAARGARNANGDRFGEVKITPTSVELDGITYNTKAMPGQWPTASGSAQAIMYDPTEFVVGVRKDVTWKLLDEAVIQDNTGAIMFNLAQQDMVAMRLTMRVGWQVANTINYDEPDEEKRYPAGLLLKA
jgi:HK97 family phage major capsid protein